MLLRVAAALRRAGSKSTGKLHTEVCPGREMTRNEFEQLLGAMARAGLLVLSDEVFEKNGKQIHSEYGTDPSVFYVDAKIGGHDNTAPEIAQTGSNIKHLKLSSVESRAREVFSKSK